jgi:hypothetical protein
MFCWPAPTTGHANASDAPGVAEFIAIVRGYDVATVRRTFPTYNTGLFALVFGSGASIPLEGEDEVALFREQLVRTPAGVILDIGHVVTGIEAASPLPPAARAIESGAGCQLRAAVTWSGDLGQALIDYLTSGTMDPAPFYSASASEEDLLGDIDGYVLGADNAGSAPDVAAILSRAYLESDFEATRFSRFLATLGNDPAAFVGREVECYAAAFARLSGMPLDADRVREAAPYFVGRFLDFSRAGASAEGAAAFR